MLIASSPVEIEAKVVEIGLSQEVHDAALRMFHELTDRIGQATVAIGTPREEWPSHRFYFGSEDGEMAALLNGLEDRADFQDVTHGVPDGASAPSGLYVQDAQASFVAVLVAHDDHEGYRSSTR